MKLRNYMQVYPRMILALPSWQYKSPREFSLWTPEYIDNGRHCTSCRTEGGLQILFARTNPKTPESRTSYIEDISVACRFFVKHKTQGDDKRSIMFKLCDRYIKQEISKSCTNTNPRNFMSTKASHHFEIPSCLCNSMGYKETSERYQQLQLFSRLQAVWWRGQRTACSVVAWSADCRQCGGVVSGLHAVWWRGQRTAGSVVAWLHAISSSANTK